MSAHLLAPRAGVTVEEGWPCQGPLLRLAVDVAERLLPGWYINKLLTKCEVKIIGYWPSSFFACLWTETESRSKLTKKNEANIHSYYTASSVSGQDEPNRPL